MTTLEATDATETRGPDARRQKMDRKETFSECTCGCQVVVWADDLDDRYERGDWFCARCNRRRSNAR